MFSTNTKKAVERNEVLFFTSELKFSSCNFVWLSMSMEESAKVSPNYSKHMCMDVCVECFINVHTRTPYHF